MGIDFSKFTHDIQAKIKAALEDTKSPDKIDAAEFRAMNLEREIANQLMQELAGNMEYIGDGYIKVQNKNKTLILLDKPENNSVIPLTKDSLEYYQELYPDKNIKKGVYNDGVLYLADEQGKPVKDNFGNYICEKISIKEYKSETEEVNGSFEIIENEPAERTNRRFAAALVRSMYNEVIQELETVVAQMGVLDAGLWREAVGMGIQAIADLKKDQELITATTVAKIKRIEKERDNICNSLNELLDSPAEFETKFYQLFGKDYKDNAFQELREIQHNQENKASAEKFRECVSKFNELFPENNISKNIEGWGGSADYQKTVDNIANIVVMFVMTGEIGKLLQGSSQAMAKNILLAAAKGDRKAVFANFAKLAPEVQTVWKSLAKKEFGVALTQTVTPMTQSAATMGSWEGVKAFLNNLTNAEEMSPEELLSRTLEGLKSGAELGVVMGGLETFAIAPVISKMTPALNKLSGAASEVSGLIEKGNGTVSMEKVMETFTKANEALKGKIVKEGAHTVVALPVLTAGFTVTDTAFHFDEEEFRKSLLDAASTEEEREAVRKMNSFDLRLEFAKNDFAEQVKGMATIEGVGIIFRRLQAGRVAAKTFKNNTPDILSVNLREVRENGKISYEICTKEGDVLPIKSGDKNITRFSSIEQATAAYGALCTGLYAELAGMMSDKKYDNQLTSYDKIGNKIFEVKQDDLSENPEKINEIKAEIETLKKTEPTKAEELAKLRNDKDIKAAYPVEVTNGEAKGKLKSANDNEMAEIKAKLQEKRKDFGVIDSDWELHTKYVLEIAKIDVDVANAILNRRDVIINKYDSDQLIEATKLNKDFTIELLNMRESKTLKSVIRGKKANQLFCHYYDVLEIVKLAQTDYELTKEVIDFAVKNKLNVNTTIQHVVELAKVDKEFALSVYKEKGHISNYESADFIESIKINKDLTVELLRANKKGNKEFTSNQIYGIVEATLKAPDFMSKIHAKFLSKELKSREYYDIATAIIELGEDFAYKTVDELTLTQKRILLNEISTWKGATGRSEIIDEMFPCLPKKHDTSTIVNLINRLTKELNSKPETVSDEKIAKFNTSIQQLFIKADKNVIKSLAEEYLPEYKKIIDNKTLSNIANMVNRIVKNKEFTKLSDNDKEITVISSILSNFKQNGEKQRDIAFNGYKTAIKLGFDEYDAQKVYSIIKSANLIEQFMATNKDKIQHVFAKKYDITNREAVFNNLAFQLKEGNTFDLAKLVYSSVEQEGLTRFLDNLLKNRINEMKADDFILYQTPIEEYKSKAHRETITGQSGKNYDVMVVHSDEIEDFYAIGHNPDGISFIKGDRPAEQRFAKIKALENITNGQAYCGFYIDGENICAIKDGFIFVVPNDKFYVGTGHDIGSSGKTVEAIIKEYFIQNDVVATTHNRSGEQETKNEERKMVSRNIKQIMGISDEEYISRLDNIKSKLIGKPFTPQNAKTIDPEFGNAYEKFLSKVNHDGTKGKEALLSDGGWNEVIVSNPKIGGIYTTDLAKISEDMLIFAKENDLPIIVLKPKTAKTEQKLKIESQRTDSEKDFAGKILRNKDLTSKSVHELFDGKYNRPLTSYDKIGNKIFEVRQKDLAEKPEKIAMIKSELEKLSKTEPEKAAELQIIYEMFTNPADVKDVTDAQIDAVVNYLNAHYDSVEKYLSAQAGEIGISDEKLGRFGHRIKGEWSTRDKIANYIKDSVIKEQKAKEKGEAFTPRTLLDAYNDVRDKYASRTVFEKSDYSKHPEIVKILEEGNYSDKAYRKAILCAAELQSQPAVDMLKEAMRKAVQEGKDLSMLRISNYTSEGGIPIFSEAQLAELEDCGVELGIDVSFIKLASEANPMSNKMIVEGATTKAQPSGYTALQVNFVTKAGEIIEWQYRGEFVNKFAEAEHLPYDLRTGKHPWRQYPELETLYKPIADLLDEKSMPKHAYKQLNKYFTDYYVHLRKLELGFESKEPMLEDYEHYKAKDENGIEKEYTFKFDKRLCAKNLEILHEYGEKIKDKSISPEEALKEYNAEVGHVELQYELPETADLVRELKKVDNIDDFRAIQTKINAMEGSWDKVQLMLACYDKYNITFKQADSPKTFEEFLEQAPKERLSIEETDRIAEREFKFSKDSIKMLKKELGNDYTKIIGFLHAGTKILGKTSELTPEALVEVYKSEQFAFEVKILSNVDIKTLEYMQKELGFEDLKDTLESVMDMFGRGGEDYIKEFQKCYEINRAIGMSFKDIKNLRSIESSKFVSVTPGQVKAAKLIVAIYGFELNATEVLSISNPELITPEFLKDLCETEKRFDEMGISVYSARDPVEHLRKLKSYEAQLKELGMDFKWYTQKGDHSIYEKKLPYSDLEKVFNDDLVEQKNKFFNACSDECKDKFKDRIIDFSCILAAKKYPAEFAEMLNALALIDCGSSNRVIWDFSNKVHADFSLANIKGVTEVAKAFAELGSFPADGSFATFMLKDYVTDKPNYQAMAKFIRELKEFYADSEYTVNDYMQEVWRGGCFEKMESSFKELKELGLYGKIAPGDLMFLLEDGYKDEVFQKVVNLHDNPLIKGKLMLYRDMPDDLLAERSKKIIELIDAQNSELTNLTLDEKIYINRKYNENLISKLLGDGCFNENYTERLNFCNIDKDVKGIVKKIINDTSDGLNIEERCRKLDEAYKLRTFYVDAKTDNIYDLHQQLIKDALANKDLLKSGLEDITDEQIVKTVNHGHAVQTIDLIGLGNTEAAFPLMLDEFDEFMHEISGLYGKLSGDSKECLLKKVNPEQTIDYKFLMAEIKDLKHKLNKAVGAENIKKIKSIQAKKAKIDEQIKQLKQGEKADTPEIKQQIKELQKQSKALGGQAQAIYYSCENAALVKEIMKNISESQKKAKKFLQENSSGLEPQEIVTKLRVLSALSNITTTKELDGFIEMIKPSTPENDMIWNEAVNRKIYEKLGVEYDEALSQKLDLIHCKYISKLFISSEDFFDNMKKLVETIKDNPDLTVEQAIDQLPQNIETKRIFEELGFDFEKYTKIDKNSYTRVEIKLNAEEAKQASIHNLEEDLNDALFQSLPKEVTEPIFKQLKEKLGVTFEKSQKDNWEGDGFSAGSTEYYRLYKDGKPITFEDMDDIVSLIKKEVVANDFWTTKHNDPQIDTARGTMYTHLIKMRTAEVDNATTIKDGETAEIEIRKTDMYDIKKALGLGNDAQCCTALGRNFNEWSAPTYIMNKCIGAIELTDKGSFVGNTMIYLAYVDGKPALILDNIELKTKYQNNDKIRDAFMDYAKKLCAEIGQPDLPIYAGPNRHKLTMDIYPKAKHSMEIIGSSGEDEVYVDYDAQGHVVGSGDRPIIEMYKIR